MAQMAPFFLQDITTPFKGGTMVAKKKTTKKTAKKGKKGAFGGLTINFSQCNETLQDIFGNKPIAPSEMTKKLWGYVKKYKIMSH